ncbi:MAG: glycoside hydrolase 100 family protein [archaeon]
MKRELIEEAYDKAIEVVKTCLTPHGLYASGGENGYKGVWSRDSFITFLGASLIKENDFSKTFKESLETLGNNQSKIGQIPNAVLKFNRKKPEVDFKSIDSSLWFVIGHHVYKKRYKDKSFFRKNISKINKALTWLSYQDVGEDITLEQQPTSDWQDAFPNKYGTTINTQALYYQVLKLSGHYLTAWKLKRAVNKNKDITLWNGEFYWAYRWKNHNTYKEIGPWFDSLGNLLAIVFGLASKSQSKNILNYIKIKKINRPYPVKAIAPPIKPGSENWEDYYLDAGATPNNYLNGGIWPYIGSFYVLSLIKMKQFKEAEQELKRLAEANLRGNFPEWIHPITKKNNGKLQAWDAGTYILAYESFKNKKVLI